MRNFLKKQDHSTTQSSGCHESIDISSKTTSPQQHFRDHNFSSSSIPFLFLRQRILTFYNQLKTKQKKKMKLSTAALLIASLVASADAYSFIQPMRVAPSIRHAGSSNLKMISTGDDRSERKSLDISKTVYTSLVKAPKDAYIAVSLLLLLVVVVM